MSHCILRIILADRNKKEEPIVVGAAYVSGAADTTKSTLALAKRALAALNSVATPLTKGPLKASGLKSLRDADDEHRLATTLAEHAFDSLGFTPYDGAHQNQYFLPFHSTNAIKIPEEIYAYAQAIIDLDIDDFRKPLARVGGAFLTPTLFEEMDDCGMELDEMIDEEKLFIVRSPEMAEILRKVLADEGLDEAELKTVADVMVQGHPYGGGGSFALPGHDRDSDILVIQGD